MAAGGHRQRRFSWQSSWPYSGHSPPSFGRPATRSWFFGTKYIPYFIPSKQQLTRATSLRPWNRARSSSRIRMSMALAAAVTMSRLGLAWGRGPAEAAAVAPSNTLITHGKPETRDCSPKCCFSPAIRWTTHCRWRPESSKATGISHRSLEPSVRVEVDPGRAGSIGPSPPAPAAARVHRRAGSCHTAFPLSTSKSRTAGSSSSHSHVVPHRRALAGLAFGDNRGGRPRWRPISG